VTKADPGVTGELSGERMVVGGKEEPAVHLAADVLQYSMGNGIAIKGAGATTELIQNHQTVLCGMLQSVIHKCIDNMFSQQTLVLS